MRSLLTGVAARERAAPCAAADAAALSAEGDDDDGDDTVKLWPPTGSAHAPAAAVKPEASQLLC